MNTLHLFCTWAKNAVTLLEPHETKLKTLKKKGTKQTYPLPLVHQPVKDCYRPGGLVGVVHHYEPKDRYKPGGGWWKSSVGGLEGGGV